MSSISKYKRARIRSLPARRTGKVGTVDRKIESLQELVSALQNQLETITDIPQPAIEDGVDFYEEVSHFEIQLIRRALRAVDGHQANAAKLLRLNSTTLNVMIKRYGLM